MCDVEEQQDESSVRHLAKILNPQLPSKEEVDEHNLTHLPFRNWCSHCVRGTGRVADHRVHQRDDGLPEVHLDYCFLGTEGNSTETILVLRERPHRMTMSTVVPMKGASVEWCVRRVLAFIKEIGLEGGDLVLKSDQEPAVVSLISEIASRRKAKTFPEHSPVASSQSNGYIERAIQSISGQVRVMLDALESRMRKPCRGSGNAALTWLVEYAAVLWNRYAVSSDGKTAYERMRGKKSRVLGVEFGEKIHWRRAIPASNRSNKLGTVWADGVYLGHKTLSGESIIGTPDD